MNGEPLGSGRPRRLVMAAIALMTVSQFFHYQATYRQQTGIAIVGGGGGDHVVADIATGTAIAHAYYTIDGVSGWSLHHHVWIVLAALAVVFGFRLRPGQVWDVWGFWIAVAGLVLCLFPTDTTMAPPGLGFYMGVVAVLIAIRAALLHRRPT